MEFNLQLKEFLIVKRLATSALQYLSSSMFYKVGCKALLNFHFKNAWMQFHLEDFDKNLLL